MSEWVFRLAEPSDAEAFSHWSAENPQIDRKDLLLGMKANNPTVLTFVAEKDGITVAFVPVFLSAMIAHLGFDPKARASEKMKALSVLKDGLMAFFVQFGIRELNTLSKSDYGIAKWAIANGFETDGRELFRLDLTREMGKEKAGAF